MIPRSGLSPANEIHLSAKILSQDQVPWITKFGQVCLELCLKALVELVSVYGNGVARKQPGLGIVDGGDGGAFRAALAVGCLRCSTGISAYTQSCF